MSAKTGYASLIILTEIANEILWPRKVDRSPAYYQCLAECLQRAQSAAGTPESLRVKAASVRFLAPAGAGHPSLTLGRPFPLPDYWMDAENFHKNARAMASAIADLAENWHRPQPPRMLMLVPFSARVINILNDFTVDFGPELFTDTLMRAMAGRDVRRIRLCPQCKRVFIALRANTSACSPACTNLLKVHKFTAANPGYYSRAARKRRAHRRARVYSRAQGKKA